MTESQKDGGRFEYCQGLAGRDDRNGPMRMFYASGQRQLEGQLRDGKPYGRWLGWYASGRPEGEADFGACEMTRLVSWYEDGKPFYELDANTRQARIFDRSGREIPAEDFKGRHPPFVEGILALTFLLQKVCP